MICGSAETNTESDLFNHASCLVEGGSLATQWIWLNVEKVAWGHQNEE